MQVVLTNRERWNRVRHWRPLGDCHACGIACGYSRFLLRQNHIGSHSVLFKLQRGRDMQIIKTLFEGVVFAGALITLCALMFVLEGLL